MIHRKKKRPEKTGRSSDQDKDYRCSTHGNIVHIDCVECCRNFRKLLKDHNCYLAGDSETKEKIMNA